MKNIKKNNNYYLKIINEISKVRTQNNINWMGILKIAFEFAPEESKKLMRKVKREDKKISSLLEKLLK